jgi:hypothetical protein
MLWSTGAITIEKIKDARIKKRTLQLPVTLNLSTGKESSRPTTFSQVGWGAPTRSYLRSITMNVDDDAIEHIVKDAKEFVKATQHKDESAMDIDTDDDRAQLGDGSDLDDSVDASEVVSLYL